jgi:hypothetical protein
MARCPKCKTSFRVPEDESPNEHGCPKCGFEPTEETKDDEQQEGSNARMSSKPFVRPIDPCILKGSVSIRLFGHASYPRVRPCGAFACAAEMFTPEPMILAFGWKELLC